MTSIPLAKLKTSKPAGKVSPEEAKYDGPDAGPFKCSTCEYFSAPRDCSKITGKVDAEGCCCLWEHK